MKYRIRSVKPKESAWFEIDYNGTAEEAANQFHCNMDGYPIKSSNLHIPHEDGGTQIAKFVQLEIEGHGSMFSRLFEVGIYRRGGVKRHPERNIRDVAAEIGWDKDPNELLETWDLEESWDDARNRKGM